MDMRDIEITTFTNSSDSIGMRLTHLPTGISVKGEGKSRFKLKESLMVELKERTSAMRETE